MPITIPVIEMIEIGAGGGSLASVDSLGQIRIGPQSAGSEPGPASYGRGGVDATVTDANLELGRLHPDTFGAPDISLSTERASEALLHSVGRDLDLSSAESARGIAEVVDENMANAARVHAVENGKDLSGYTMIAFGGGGPLHASRLMDKLGLEELVVPLDAGVGSAVGFLRAPFSYEAIRSFYTSTADFDVAGVNRLLDELTDEATDFVRQGTSDPVEIEKQVAMRYRGQGWEIPVTLSDAIFDDTAAELLAAQFTKAYEEFFGRAIDDLPIEAVSWSVKVSSIVLQPDPVELSTIGDEVPPSENRSLYDPVTGDDQIAGLYHRDRLNDGDQIQGPAVIVESQTTTVLGSHHMATVQVDGALLVHRRDGLEP